MQIGIAPLVGGLIAIALLIGGAFAVGTKWDGDTESSAETAAAVSALKSDSEFSDEEFLEADEETPAPEGAPLYKVLRVVDGDTIVIEVDGKSESVRMIGVDTPELNDSRTGVQCFAKEAAEKTKALVTGKSIRFEKDPSQGDRDKYKRLLGYVFLENGGFVNKALIEGGFAHEYTYDDAYKYQKQFKAAQAAAKEAEAGLWAPDVCPPEKAATKAKTPAPPKTTTSNTNQAAAAAAAAAPPAQPIQQPVQQQAVQPTTTPQPEPKKEEPKPEPKEEPKPEPKKDPDPPLEPSPKSLEPSSIVCSRNAYNCTDFETKKDAQEVYDQCGGVGNDIHRLDNNKDGSACDSLP
ncbi:MAG: thermonuclease family protein [Patescibacteria group bacterium]